MKESLCPICVHYHTEELEAYYQDLWNYGRRWMPAVTAYFCKAQKKAIQRMRSKCSYYISIYQTKLKVVSNGMVKIEDIPSEGERIELTDLPENVELIAISEKHKAAADGKAAGLVIRYMVRDERSFDQKYTKLSGHILFKALERLKIADTEDLQKTWYHYKLTPMRMGFPRMIPTKKCAKQ